MLTDSQTYLCSQFTDSIQPISQKYKLGGIPKNMQRVSSNRILLCDPNQQLKKTRLIQLKIKPKLQQSVVPKVVTTASIAEQYTIEEQRVLQEFEGVYTSWNFMQDNYALLLNKEGDFLFYNLNSKSIFEAQKQHPGLYYDAETMHTNQHFVTCGGSFKNQQNNHTERIIKVWQICNSESLIQKSRINTGHKKPIQHSFLLNKCSVLTLSSDKSLRITSLQSQQISSIIQTDIQLLSGCQIDYSTVLAGGNCKNIKIYDIRDRKMLNMYPKIQENLVHIVGFCRFAESTVLASNINGIFAVDLRNWGVRELGAYQDGQINSQILTLNQRDFIIGNRQKTIQVWRAK